MLPHASSKCLYCVMLDWAHSYQAAQRDPVTSAHITTAQTPGTILWLAHMTSALMYT